MHSKQKGMNKKKKVQFIINPISGGTSKKLIVRAIETRMDRNLYEWDVVYTTHGGHGAEMAKELAEQNYDVVVAVGGDGTISEIASSLVNTQTALGIIPCGSGNGLARHLHLPLEYAKAVDVINECAIKTIDYGKINNQPFFCTCGMGFDAYISAKFDKSMKRGPITYVENAIREIVNYTPETYTLIDENGKENTYKAFCITCANASQYGNNAYIAPKASLEDGLIDVTIVEPFNIAEAPVLAVQFLNGTLPNKGNVKMFQTKCLHIRREKEGYLHRDGDPFIGGKDIYIEAVPHDLNVIVNQKAKIKPISFIQAVSIVFRNKLYSNTVLGQTVSRSGKEIIEKLGLD